MLMYYDSANRVRGQRTVLMKRAIVLLLCVLVVPVALSAEGNGRDAGREVVRGRGEFPRVARRQDRPTSPRVKRNEDCGTMGTPPCNIDDGGSGGLAQGSCNCKRACNANGIQCNFTGDWATKCKINSNNTCGQCEKDCGG